MAENVTLVGLDCGTTTSSLVVASADLVRGAVGGRVDLTNFRERFRSPMEFTPLADDERLDLARFEALLDEWCAAAALERASIFGGGTLLTGLAAEKENARGVVALVRRRFGEVLVATAADPCLESWLAFMGSCGELSQTLADVPILNLDIGGGTTNSAIGFGGQVAATGCLFVGARHVRFEPGGYLIVGLSRYARLLFEQLGIRRSIGDELSAAQRDRIVEAYVELIAALVAGQPIAPPLGEFLEQVPLARYGRQADLAVTFSGGVGELIYRHWAGEPWPATTEFGDLGIDLARRLTKLAEREPERYRLRPVAGGRATSFGLMRHTTETSGSTLFLPRPDVLPLADLPILGRIDSASESAALRESLKFVMRSACGGALQASFVGEPAAEVRSFGTRLAEALDEVAFPQTLPLVLLVRENIGKTLGQYATRWGAVRRALVVVDEVPPRAAQYLQLGALRSGIVPVSFYGLRPTEDMR